MSVKNKKEVILEAAIDIIYKKGFNAATTAEIAAKAGVAEGTIFRYFKTKKDILLNVILSFIDRFGDIMIVRPLQEIFENNKEKDIEYILKMVIKDRLSFLDQNTEIMWIVVTEMKYHPELKEAMLEKVGKKVLKLIEDFFEYGIDNNAFKEYDTMTLSRVLLSTILATTLQYKFFSSSIPSSKSMDDFIDESLKIFLHGASKEGQKE